jgi:hypothetical protein
MHDGVEVSKVLREYGTKGVAIIFFTSGRRGIDE